MSFKVTRLTLGKGRTEGDEKVERWTRRYYEIEVIIEDEHDIELAKASIEGLIDGWLTGPNQTLGPAGVKQISAVKEETFNVLKWDAQEGSKIGAYDVAYKATNLPEKWNQAFNILRQNNAVINAKYKAEGYGFSYWLYGEDKIYRQRLKKQG